MTKMKAYTFKQAFGLNARLHNSIAGTTIAHNEWVLVNNSRRALILIDSNNKKVEVAPNKTSKDYTEDKVLISIRDSICNLRNGRERARFNKYNTTLLAEEGDDRAVVRRDSDILMTTLMNHGHLFITEINMTLVIKGMDDGVMHPYSDEAVKVRDNKYRNKLIYAFENRNPIIALTANLNREEIDLDYITVELLGTIFTVKVSNIGDDNRLTIMHRQGAKYLDKDIKEKIDGGVINIPLDELIKNGNMSYKVGHESHGILIGYTSDDICDLKMKLLKRNGTEALKKELTVKENVIEKNDQQIFALQQKIERLKYEQKQELNDLKSDIKTIRRDNKDETDKIDSSNKQVLKDLKQEIDTLNHDHKLEVDRLKHDYKQEIHDHKRETNKITQEHKQEVRDIKRIHKDVINERDDKNKQWSRDTIGKVIVHAIAVVINVFKDVFMLKWVMT